jgi:hypothetical protein
MQVKFIKDHNNFKAGQVVQAEFEFDQAASNSTNSDGKPHKVYSVVSSVWVPTAKRFIEGKIFVSEGIHIEVV